MTERVQDENTHRELQSMGRQLGQIKDAITAVVNSDMSGDVHAELVRTNSLLEDILHALRRK